MGRSQKVTASFETNRHVKLDSQRMLDLSALQKYREAVRAAHRLETYFHTPTDVIDEVAPVQGERPDTISQATRVSLEPFLRLGTPTAPV